MATEDIQNKEGMHNKRHPANFIILSGVLVFAILALLFIYLLLHTQPAAKKLKVDAPATNTAPTYPGPSICDDVNVSEQDRSVASALVLTVMTIGHDR